MALLIFLYATINKIQRAFLLFWGHSEIVLRLPKCEMCFNVHCWIVIDWSLLLFCCVPPHEHPAQWALLLSRLVVWVFCRINWVQFVGPEQLDGCLWCGAKRSLINISTRGFFHFMKLSVSFHDLPFAYGCVSFLCAGIRLHNISLMIARPSLGPEQKLCPLHLVDLVLLVWHCALKLWFLWLKMQLSNECR